MTDRLNSILRVKLFEVMRISTAHHPRHAGTLLPGLLWLYRLLEKGEQVRQLL